MDQLLDAVAQAALPYLPHLVVAALTFVTSWLWHRAALLAAATKAVQTASQVEPDPDASVAKAAAELGKSLVGKLAGAVTTERVVRAAAQKLRDSKRPPAGPSGQ
jgi:predicted MFS family arabinose efflux permease